MSRVRVPDGVPEFRQRKLMKIERRTWPVGQVVKTEASHAFNIGSNPVRVTSSSGKKQLTGSTGCARIKRLEAGRLLTINDGEEPSI